MLYQDEFSRMKTIYNQMPPMKRDLIGPILALPLVAMALFFFVLLPFGLASLGLVLLAGLMGAAISALMMMTMLDIRKEFAQWRASAAPAAAVSSIPGELAIQLLTVANDPGQETAEIDAEKASAEG